MANPKEVTLHDFVNWCIQKIDAYQLSMLMAQYGYSSYTVDNVVALLKVDKTFVENFGTLVRAATDNEGYNVPGEITVNDWAAIANAPRHLDRASGDFDINQAVDDTASLFKNIFGKKTDETTGTAPAGTSDKKETGSNVFLYVIGGVVVLAIVIILAFSLKK